MVELIVARILHVIGVVLWIGGVAMVTTVLLPATRRLKAPEERCSSSSRSRRGLPVKRDGQC